MINFFAHETVYLDENIDIGDDTKIWHFSHIQNGAIIGEKCVLGQNVYIGANVKIGNNVKVQNNVSIYTGVTVEDDVFLGPSMVFTNILNPRSFINRKYKFKETRVCKGVSIGANVTIVCGVTIGEYAMIGAGSVVTHDIKPYALIYGVPAKLMGWVCQCGTKFDYIVNDIYTCPECRIKYRLLKNKSIQKIG